MAQDANQPLSPDELRVKIEQTRSEMTQTLARIQSRLRPAHLAAQAKRSVTNATVNSVKGAARRVEATARDVVHRPADTGAKLVGLVRRYPVPAAFLGLMTAWWVAKAMPRRPRVAVATRRNGIHPVNSDSVSRLGLSHATNPSWRR